MRTGRGQCAAKADWVVPPSIAWIAGPAPENGTWVMLDAADNLEQLAREMRRGADPGLA